MPISAITGRADIMDAAHVGGLGGTYGGNPIAAAAALAVIEKIEREDLLGASRQVGKTVMANFNELAANHQIVGDVRGRGAMCAMELVSDRTTKEPVEAATMSAITKTCLENGVIVITAGTYGNVIRLLPPLNIDPGLLEDGLGVLDQAIAASG
jgi:4-aminobutyrate aminotransferase/(S)-3-amino-2-methylpropionate transaminase